MDTILEPVCCKKRQKRFHDQFRTTKDSLFPKPVTGHDFFCCCLQQTSSSRGSPVYVYLELYLYSEVRVLTYSCSCIHFMRQVREWKKDQRGWELATRNRSRLNLQIGHSNVSLNSWPGHVFVLVLNRLGWLRVQRLCCSSWRDENTCTQLKSGALRFLL